MYLYHHHHLPSNYAAISCLIVYLLVQSAATGTQVTRASQVDSFQQPNYSNDALYAGDSAEPIGQLERRTGGRGTQVAISLERVKNPDDYPSPYKKKKFPIMWLRNQYPFNNYYKKKKKDEYSKQGKYKGQDTLVGQYSHESVEVLDPNPSSWVRIPNRPTASISLRPQQPSYDFIHPPQGPPASLQYRPSQPELILASSSANLMMPSGAPQFAPLSPAPRPDNFAQHAGGGMMTSESQQDYSQSGAQKQAEPQSGFGGISLSFGNGRSISFGGGQGLTIGGRAGAISIGGSKSGGDQQPAASGYSETKGGSYQSKQAAANQQTATAATATAGGSYGGGQSSYGSDSNGSNGYGYVSKHPTMSMDFPRKGKTIVHANLDMAPIKFRLHSSPRVKITTGSRDPLEKPSDDELTESEEDIFEQPEPFAKPNATSAANETTVNNNATANGNETTTLSPMQLQQFGANKYPQGFNQQQQYYQVQQQQQVYSHSQQVPINAGQFRPQQQQQNIAYNGQYASEFKPNGPIGYQPNNPPLPPHPQQPLYQHQGPQYIPATQQHLRQPVFDDAPHHAVQQVIQPSGQYVQQEHYQTQQQQIVGVTEAQNQVPHHQFPPHVNQAQLYKQQAGPAMRPQFNEQQQQLPIVGNQQAAQMMMMMPVNGDERPAVNQWKQFSREAREQMSKSLPKNHDLTADNNPKFYNGDHHSNSIVEPSSQQQRQSTGDSVEAAASDKIGSYASGANVQQPNKQNRPPISVVPVPHNEVPLQHPQFGKATLYQVAGQQELQPLQQAQQAAPLNGGQKLVNPQRQQPVNAPQAVSKQQVLDGQESNYHAAQSNYHHQQQTGGYNRGSSSYKSPGNQQGEAVRTYTFGNGGLSTHYGSGSGGGSGDHSYSGSSSSDGFDQKSYAAKVEKFDPEAHDKRERSKVVLFLKPRISIHMANSSTTTKRPKNPQRFINVVNRPIFLNSTNMTHADEEFIDPDLKEPMDVSYGYGYGHGYGNSYGRGYSTKNATKTTTRKPKTTTTTTTTSTTTSPDSDTTTTSTGSTSSDSDSTTSSSSSSDTTTSATATTTTTTATPDTSSSSTESPSSTTTEASTTTTEASNPSSTPSEEQSTTASSSSETSRDSSEESSSRLPPASTSSTSSTSSSPEAERSSSPLPDEVSVVDIERVPEVESGNGNTEPTGTTENPEVESVTNSSASDDESGSSADLVAAATESTPAMTSSTSTTPKVPVKSRTPRTSTTTSTTTTTTTTTTEPPATTTTSEMPPTTQVQEQETSTTTTMAPAAPDEVPSTTVAAVTTEGQRGPTSTEQSSSSSAASVPTSTDDSDIVESQGQTKRSLPTGDHQAEATTGAKQQQPMLLNAELIDKLMSNRTLVNLMSSQLKRVIDTERMSDEEKRRIVRQVFDQMMEEKVDFSMNNVRLAVKTVSSSYRAAAEKQRKRSSSFVETSSSPAEKKSFGAGGKSKLDLKGFGRRASVASSQTSATAAGSKSKSFPVIDTALKLTKGGKSGQQQSAIGHSKGSSNGKQRTDSSGNPIVVVLLPQEKA